MDLAHRQPIFTNNPNCIDGRTLTYTWEGADFCWDTAASIDKAFCWSDVSLILRISGEDPIATKKNYDALDEHEKDEFISLTCKVKGYEPTETKKKKVKANLTADDVQFIVDEVMKEVNIKISED